LRNYDTIALTCIPLARTGCRVPDNARVCVRVITFIYGRSGARNYTIRILVIRRMPLLRKSVIFSWSAMKIKKRICKFAG